LKQFKHDFVTLPKMQRITEESGSRYYLTPAGNRYQSVTTLTGNWNKKAILEWRQRVGEEKANEISSKAATRGTKLHKTVEDYLLNNMTERYSFGANPLTKSLFYRLKPVVDRLDNIKLVEGTMFSDSLELAGTTDCIAEYNGKLAVIDFKTSTRAKKKQDIKNYFMQGGAYGRMYEELYGQTPELVVIMMVVESLNYPVTYIEPYKPCYEMLVEFKNSLDKPTLV
jgi:genome maintenance exonuclease 1